LDDEDSEENGIRGIEEGGLEGNSSNSSDEADENQIADSLVSGVNDY
jgi:hypothetical protein